jgi:hypothetical protein
VTGRGILPPIVSFDLFRVLSLVGNTKITRLKIFHRVSNFIQTRFPF